MGAVMIKNKILINLNTNIITFILVTYFLFLLDNRLGTEDKAPHLKASILPH